MDNDVVVRVTNHKNKLTVAKKLVLNGDNIISYTNEMIDWVNYKFNPSIVDNDFLVDYMESRYKELYGVVGNRVKS